MRRSVPACPAECRFALSHKRSDRLAVPNRTGLYRPLLPDLADDLADAAMQDQCSRFGFGTRREPEWTARIPRGRNPEKPFEPLKRGSLSEASMFEEQPTFRLCRDSSGT